jgi:hypothetical protein
MSSEWVSFTVNRCHIHRNGLAMMPTAGPFPQPAQVVALHGGLDFDCISYVAERRGAWPIGISPITTNKNRVFLNGGRCGIWPIPDVAGVMNYCVSGWILWGILSPEGLASDFMLGNMPFVIPGVPPVQQMAGANFSYQLLNQGITQVLTLVPSQPSQIMNMVSKG